MRFYARLGSKGERPLSPTTIAHTHSLINSAMKWAHRKGRTNRNRTRNSGSRPLPLNTRESFPVRVFAFSTPFRSLRILASFAESVRWPLEEQALALPVDGCAFYEHPTQQLVLRHRLGSLMPICRWDTAAVPPQIPDRLPRL